jgi:prepilin-type N-terminal cleavage/methylation domain-containing protein
MKQDGVTLIELVVVIAIIGILVVALGFQFIGWRARYNVESEIKTMHIDLTTARQRAMQKNVQYVAVVPAVNGNNYRVCEDTNGNNQCDSTSETTGSSISQSLSKNNLGYPVNSDLPGALIMNTKGMFMVVDGGAVSDIDNTAPNNIWLKNPDTGGFYGPSEVDYDCMSISTTRIGLGKYDNDGNQTICKKLQSCCVK